MSGGESPDTTTEVRERLFAERDGRPFVVFRDAEGSQRIVFLEGDKLLVGRDPASDLCLGWDRLVSGLHARLEREGRYWTLHDDGLSRNGSFVNGERIHGQCVLQDGDALRFGATTLEYRNIASRSQPTTMVARPEDVVATVSPAQKRVLIALCRPYKGRPAFARPATNQEIADGLVLTVEAVKSHLRVLFAKFDLEHLPPNEKRVRLVEHVLRAGLVREHEL